MAMYYNAIVEDNDTYIIISHHKIKFKNSLEWTLAMLLQGITTPIQQFKISDL